MRKKNIGVCICRLQTPMLTEGHLRLFDEASFYSDELIVILGIAPTMLSVDNPLNYDMRKDMVKSIFPNATIIGVKDIPDDLLWSNEVDKVLLPYSEDNITIYGGRDSFIPYYLGSYKTFNIGETPFDHINATQYRNKLKDYNNFLSLAKEAFPNTEIPNEILEFGFRCGVIWSSQNKFPVAFATVDIGVVKLDEDKPKIILGKKYKQNVWVIVGGFVDPEDDNYSFAANRELGEEVKGIKTTPLRFIDSVKIDDWRYRKSQDKIITNLFITKWIDGEPKGADDLEFAEFFTFDEAFNVVGEHHKPLLKLIQSNLHLV